MKSKRFASLLSVVMVAIAGLAWLPASYAKSEAEVEAEAAQLFAKIKASAPLTTDRVTIDYISCVANAVVEVLGPPHNSYNWEMAILETDDVNAMVMPGGKIIIFEGLLKTAQDQDQLAAVIGHEIAHVTAGHTKGNMFQGKSAQIGIQVLAVLVGQGHSGASYSAYEAINQGAMYGILLPYKRSQETEADVVGLQYMARAGFDPRAAVPLWQNMRDEGGEARAEFLSTHPSSDKRIDSLVSQWIEVLPLYNEAQAEGRIPQCVPPPEKQSSEEE